MRVRLLAVTAVLCALVGVGEATRGVPPDPAGPVSAPVAGGAVACPEVAGATVSAGASGSGAGSLRSGPPGGPYAAVPVLQAGQVAPLPRSEGAVVVQARDAVAAGLGVELHARELSGPRRGLSALRCEPAGTSSWFAGGATVSGSRAELVLVNAEDSVALVDVTAWSATGPVERRPGRGIAVPPRGRTVVELDTVAPDRDLLALHVQATRGRVAAALRHSRADGRTPGGVDWVPASPGPAREVLVAGLPGGPGGRTVVVTNPGEDATTVTLALLTDDGQVDLEPLDVPAGTSVTQDVSEELARTPAAVVVRSAGGPVLAAGRVDEGRPGSVRELAWAGAAAPLTGPALLADVPLSPSAEVVLLLSAPAQDAAVELTRLPVAGQDGGRTALERVEVPGGTTVAVALSELLPAGSPGRFAVELRATGGPVVAARLSRERSSGGPLSALLPVVPAAGAVRRPAVLADELAGRPSG